MTLPHFSAVSVKHMTSSPHYPQSNGFIERHTQTMNNLIFKALDTDTQPFQNVLAELRSTKIRNGVPSPAEILDQFGYRGSSNSGPCCCESNTPQEAAKV